MGGEKGMKSNLEGEVDMGKKITEFHRSDRDR